MTDPLSRRESACDCGVLDGMDTIYIGALQHFKQRTLCAMVVGLSWFMWHEINFLTIQPCCFLKSWKWGFILVLFVAVEPSYGGDSAKEAKPRALIAKNFVMGLMSHMA